MKICSEVSTAAILKKQHLQNRCRRLWLSPYRRRPTNNKLQLFCLERNGINYKNENYYQNNMCAIWN